MDLKQIEKRISELFSRNDRVYKSMLKQKLRALEIVGELGFCRLLDNSSAGKADKRFRLCENDIALHSKARGDAAGAIMRIFHWDVAGSLPILLEAGGCIDCLGGRPFQIKELNKENPQLPVLILSNPQAREQLIHSIQVK